MAIKHLPLTGSEQEFWDKAFLKAELTVLLKNRRINPAGAAHLAREYADAAVIERRTVIQESKS